MLAAASSLLSSMARSAISQNYSLTTIGQSAPPTSNGLPLPAPSLPFTAGMWKVSQASHKVTNKRVSIWTADKRNAEMDRLSAAAKERVLEVLKAEAAALSRLRHPCILEMVEPLEETRSELVFATEPLMSSLQLAIPPSGRGTAVELDEIEIQKGILQLCKGLAFLHTSARLIHTNLTPQSVVVNSAGDWKLAGLGLTVPLVGSDGTVTRWEFIQFDTRVPSSVQRSLDFLAPEYAPDTPVSAATDMFSLGALIFAVHAKGSPPFRNHGSMNTMRDNAGKPIIGMEMWDADLRNLITSLLAQHSSSRPSPATLPTHAFFSSLPISTLNFLDRSNFASKSREEKIIFMKGLTSVLDRFSDGLKTRKILPSLLEEMKDVQLLTSILPSVFVISNVLSPAQFASLVLPSLTPLFAIKDPPQNMITLLDNLQLLQGKTDKKVFREHVLPLVYNALESEHAVVQERALGVVPSLCESIDYAEVQGVLFPRVALVFTKTRILGVKVSTLVCFLSMVKTLDQASLTQKLVPLLSRIRTKEPAVMLATLDVQEAMGMKVDRDAVATLVLPQLWTMSIGPLLNLEQFTRFMRVIRVLGDRVEKEHAQHLRDSQRIEDRSTPATNGIHAGAAAQHGSVNFETLVGGSASTGSPHAASADAPWDDVWGSILSDDTPPVAIQTAHSQSLPGTPRVLPAGVSSAQPLRPSPASSSAHKLSPPSRAPFPPAQAVRVQSQPSLAPPPASTFSRTLSPLQSSPIVMGSPVMAPVRLQSHVSAPTHSTGPQKPNYNISLAPSQPLQVSYTPLAPTASAWSANSQSAKQASQQDWGDFDPLA